MACESLSILSTWKPAWIRTVSAARGNTGLPVRANGAQIRPASPAALIAKRGVNVRGTENPNSPSS